MANAGKTLIITEKPSVALDVSKALGGFEKKADYYESDKYLMTWAVGHLVELLPPEDIDPKYKRWLLQDLPILPESFQYKPKDGQKDRLSTIKSLAKRKETVALINACDAGREGELIFRELYDYCEQNLPIKRLWLQSMTPAAIRDGFAALKPGEEYNHLADAARCRAESDWLIGMNGTRAMTRRLRPKNQKGSSWSVGRVQTPTLALIVEREFEILKHRPESYWTIEGRFSTPTHAYSGAWFDPKFKKAAVTDDEENQAVRDKEDRIFSKSQLDAMIEILEKNKSKAIASETRKETKEIAPQLFDLTTLQREANKRFGMAASRTLQGAQRLYEKHKLITYPRTDSKYLPEDYQKVCIEVLEKFIDADGVTGIVSTASKRIVKSGLLNKERIFSNKHISDHFAVIPTGEIPGKLEGDDFRIYDLIVRRFLAAFMSHAVWAKVERVTKVEEHHFRTRVQDLQVPGWREVYGNDTEEESRLPTLDEKNPEAKVPVLTEQFTPDQSQTKPLPRFSEARLLSLMEHAGRQIDDEEKALALKDKGIGTPATRADIIENLVIKEYATRVGRALKPTSKAIRLVDMIARIPITALASVELTGEMESQLKAMEKGLKKRSQFMKEMTDFTTEMIEKARSFDYDKIFAAEPPLGGCPSCKKGKVFESFWMYKCSEEKDGCSFIVWKEKNGRYIDRSLMLDVLAKEKAGPFEFFNSGGIPYYSMLTAQPEGLLFVDENGVVQETAESKEVVVLNSWELPSTFLGMPGKVIETNVAFLCEFGTGVVAEAAAAPKKPSKAKKAKEAEASAKPAVPKKVTKPKRLAARMPKLLCHHPVTYEEFKFFIETGATPLIVDFKSKKGRPFGARLHLKPNGNFEFKFESLKKKKEPVADGDSAETSAQSGEVAAKPKAKASKSKAKVVRKPKEAVGAVSGPV